MMPKKRYISLFFGCFVWALHLGAVDSRLLVFSIQLPPQDVVFAAQQDFVQQKGDEKIQKMGSMPPDKFAKKMIKGLIPSDSLPKSSSGIMALYGGYAAYSDKMGMINFPLRHDGKQVDVVVTPSMDLERLYKETFSGVFISQKTMIDSGISNSMPPQRYLFSQVEAPVVPVAGDATAPKQDSNGSVIGSWQVVKSAVGFDTRLPAETVIILANPKNIFVPLGSFMSMVKPHVVVPDIYLIGKKFNDAVLLNNQKNTRYFEEIVVANGTVVQKEKNIEVRQSAVMND